jgi:hypothetical protein
MKTTETKAAAETATVAEQGAHVAPEKAASKKGASKQKGAPKGQKPAKAAATKKAAATSKESKAPKNATKPTAPKETKAPRAESKGAKILELIGRSKGATLAEIMTATDWQAHSIRGFISGVVGKKMALEVESRKNDAGERAYRIVKK